MPPNSPPPNYGSDDLDLHAHRGPLPVPVPVDQALLHRRIVMNPPESFIVAAAAANPPNQQVAGPIAIGQGGQAVMIASDGGDDDSQVGQIVVSGSVLQVEAPTTTSASTTSDVDTSTAQPTSTDSSATFSITSTTTLSNVPLSQTSISSNTVTATTSSPSVTAVSSVSVMTSVLTLTSSIAVSSTSHTASSTSAIRSIADSTSSATTTSTSTAGTGMHHFLHSTPFYLLLILGALLLLAILATIFSWMVRHSCFPCCRPEVDDEGLNDLVQSFHPPSRSSTIRRMSLSEKTFDETALGRRSSLFATEGKSPFLHSGTSELGEGDFGLPMMAGLSGFGGGGSIKVPTPAHLYGETGPLEVRNAMPGEVEGEDEERGPMHGTPRFLGVDGTGLDVPWSRQSSGIGLGIRSDHDNVHLTDPYLSPPDARDYLGPPFPSPPETVDEHSHSNPIATTTSTATSSPDSPQRAGTWASNLRSTLFAAISAARAPARAAHNDDDEDKFTRTVLPLHRASTRRAAAAFPIVVEDSSEQHGSGGKGDGYESYRMPESDVEVIGSVFLAPSLSTTSSSSSLSSITRPTHAKSKRLPLRGSAGERYKRYYTRSQQSVASTVDEESCAGWSDSEMGYGPSRLAGGERARGVKSQDQGQELV
ncbi:hypothetical protein BCR39DRAFT_585063 [Naematelia encephala]|uniref:Uncharacterized protein n=1 Tax=Naematelia encephala TaxID=71784 RepID=A0A1Y2BKX7_9TREE|nr:hypothetical protein BCR39DRAFT_585063 [Naematelia encephala]